MRSSVLEPASRGTINVLRSCVRAGTVRRVVFTSSVTAVVWTGDADKEDGHLAVDERCWSDLAFCRKFKVRASVRVNH